MGMIWGPVAGTMGLALTGGRMGLMACMGGCLATKGKAAAVVCKTGGGGLLLAGMSPMAETGMGLASRGGPGTLTLEGGKGTLMGT